MKPFILFGALLAAGAAMVGIRHKSLRSQQIKLWKSLLDSTSAPDTSSVMSQLLTMISRIQTRFMGKQHEGTSASDPYKIHVHLLEDLVGRVEHDSVIGLYFTKCTALAALIRLNSPKHIQLLPMRLIESLACNNEDERAAAENIINLQSFFKTMPDYSSELARLLLDPLAEKDPVGLAQHIHYELTGAITI